VNWQSRVIRIAGSQAAEGSGKNFSRFLHSGPPLAVLRSKWPGIQHQESISTALRASQWPCLTDSSVRLGMTPRSISSYLRGWQKISLDGHALAVYDRYITIIMDSRWWTTNNECRISKKQYRISKGKFVASWLCGCEAVVQNRANLLHFSVRVYSGSFVVKFWTG